VAGLCGRFVWPVCVAGLCGLRFWPNNNFGSIGVITIICNNRNNARRTAHGGGLRAVISFVRCEKLKLKLPSSSCFQCLNMSSSWSRFKIRRVVSVLQYCPSLLCNFYRRRRRWTTRRRRLGGCGILVCQIWRAVYTPRRAVYTPRYACER
jgi:hypothetical protein